MKIHGPNGAPKVQALPVRRRQAAPPEAPPSRASVFLSPTARALAAARAPEAPDLERVGRLQAALVEGRLSIDAGAIADAILALERSE